MPYYIGDLKRDPNIQKYPHSRCLLSPSAVDVVSRNGSCGAGGGASGAGDPVALLMLPGLLVLLLLLV